MSAPTRSTKQEENEEKQKEFIPNCFGAKKQTNIEMILNKDIIHPFNFVFLLISSLESHLTCALCRSEKKEKLRLLLVNVTVTIARS